jgi:hypothetical protein
VRKTQRKNQRIPSAGYPALSPVLSAGHSKRWFWKSPHFYVIHKNIKYLCRKESGMAIRFFYLPKGRKYNYQPRYYDERKEELERRKRRIDRELGLDEEAQKDVYIPNIKGQMRKHLKMRKKAKKASTLRLLIILAFLIFITFMLLQI